MEYDNITTEQEQPAESPARALHKVSKDTVSALDKIIDNRFYPEILTALQSGKATVELRKTIMLRAIDEKWISAIEDVAPSIDLLTKNPRKYIEEVEYILPISQSTSIKPKSIRHLAQHVDYISEVKGDTVTPTKILNIFNEETLMTYENKFLNTLIHRLAAFVHKRYMATKDHPSNSRASKLIFDEEFMLGSSKGHINFTMEVEEPLEEQTSGTASAARANSMDLWNRLQRVNGVCHSFENSEFCKTMGQATIRPPVIRTNAILKNKNFRECLALWEFIEAYEDVGYSMSVEEHLENISEDYIRNLYSTMAVEYVLFKDKIKGEFIEENTLSTVSSQLEFNPQVVEDIQPTPAEEFNAHFGLRVPNPNTSHELTELDRRILAAIDAAIDADNYQKQLERLKKARASILNRSFISKIIQGSDTIQGRYTLLKNALLTYNGIKSAISWTGETFSLGSTRYAIIGLKGKSLVVYLAIDPATVDEEKYHHKDYSDKARYARTPLMMRISGKSAVFQTIELIDRMLSEVTNKNLDYTMEDFAMPYETDAQLISEGLIRADENYQAGDEETVEKNDIIDFTSAEGAAVRYGTSKVTRSFMAKLIQADESMQMMYEGIKNALLSYEGIKARLSKTRETFNKGRIKAADVTIRGKSILLSLALDPKAYEVSKYHHADKSVAGKKVDLPFELKIRSARSYKYALELITDVMQAKDIAFASEAHETYRYDYMTDAELVDQGLASVSGGSALSPYKKEYDYTFVAAVTLAPRSMIGWYTQAKNAFMCYKHVHSKMGEYYETIYKGRDIIARFAVKNDQLTCFVALNPDDIMQGTCPHRAFTMIPYLEITPMAVVLSSPRVVQQLANTIDDYLVPKFKLVKNKNWQDEDWAFDAKNEQQLIAGGLIHVDEAALSAAEAEEEAEDAKAAGEEPAAEAGPEAPAAPEGEPVAVAEPEAPAAPEGEADAAEPQAEPAPEAPAADEKPAPNVWEDASMTVEDAAALPAGTTMEELQQLIDELGSGAESAPASGAPAGTEEISGGDSPEDDEPLPEISIESHDEDFAPGATLSQTDEEPEEQAFIPLFEEEEDIPEPAGTNEDYDKETSSFIGKLKNLIKRNKD